MNGNRGCEAMSQMTQPELHSLRELLWMEAANYEKFRMYRKNAGETHIRELCDHLLGRTRQHVMALAELVDAERPEVH